MRTVSKVSVRNGFSSKNPKLLKANCVLFRTSNALKTTLNTHIKDHECTKLTGNEALKKIKDLNRSNKQSMVKEAFKIYSNLDNTEKNKFVINALLDCCKKISKQTVDFDTMKVIDQIKPLIIEDNNNVYGKNTLITIYSQCKDIKNAIKIFDSIPEMKKNIYSIGSMMTAYNNNRQYHKTIFLHQQYNNVDYIKHNDTSNMLFIKACINNTDYDKCKELIDSTSKQDINCRSVEFITTLIDYYGKIGDVDKALNVFNNLTENKRNIASINSMMNAYNNNKQYDKSISLHEHYVDGKHYNKHHNDISNVLFIKACINICDYDNAKKFINSNIDKQGINNHSIELINTLIDLYGKSNDINVALDIFNKIPSHKKDIVSINAMMTAFNYNKDYDQTISLYEQCSDIIQDNEIPNLLFIKACSNSGHFDKAKQIIDTKFGSININSCDIEFVTTLIDFYGKAGEIDNALKIFHDFPENRKGIISVGAMMNAYINNKEYEKCISLYEAFDGKHNDISNMLFIKACINSADYVKGINLIDSVVKNDANVNSHSIEFITTLIDFYGKIGDVNNALKILNNLSENKRNFVSINSMMNVYINTEQYEEAISLYQKHYQLLIHEDASNMLFIKACINNNDYARGQKVIDSIVKNTDINNHSTELITALILFYCKKGDTLNATNIFDNLPENKRSMIQVDALMNAYNNNEQYDKTISLYQQFNNDKYEYDDISNTLFIKACSNIGNYHQAKKLMDSIECRDGINNHDAEFINTLIVFYGKHGDIDEAINIFNNMPLNKRNVSSIGAMMNAFNYNTRYNETINLFNKIKDDDNIIMNEYIYSTTLIAAGNLVSLHKGSMIIGDLKLNNPNILKSLFVQSAMISMYAKCNKFQEAINIFNENINNNCGHTQKDKNGVLYLYSAMMDCYAKMGDIEQLLLLFNKLKKDERINDKITKSIYNIVLNGCSHSGLMDKALSIFDEMQSEYGYNQNNIDVQSITPLIDGLGRTGNDDYLNKAENLYKVYIMNNVNIDYKLKLPALYSLLSSCRVHNDIIRAQRIFEMIISIDPNDENAYISLSNLYGQNKQFDKVNDVREMMGKKKRA